MSIMEKADRKTIKTGGGYYSDLLDERNELRKEAAFLRKENQELKGKCKMESWSKCKMEPWTQKFWNRIFDRCEELAESDPKIYADDFVWRTDRPCNPMAVLYDILDVGEDLPTLRAVLEGHYDSYWANDPEGCHELMILHMAEMLKVISSEELDVDGADMVNHPPHYTEGEIECIDAIRAALSEEEFRGYVKGLVIKYIWREQHKGGDEDLAKARWYIDELLGDWQS